MTTFKELGLNSEIMKSLDDLGFAEPFSIQIEAIPFILKTKQDLIALAQTGTGKTAAFGLPILHQIDADGKNLQAIILCPTRELCLQITQDIKTYSKYSKGMSVTSVYGGENINLQINSLRRGTNIVVGTPGRVHDLIRRNVLKLQDIKWVVLDEADEMLDMGFKKDLDAILEQTPKTRQTLLFSATMSKSVSNIAKNYMKDAKEISIGNKNVGAENVTHEYYVVQASDRFEALKRILDYIPGIYGILFCRTRRETQEIADKLNRANYDAEAIHGEISQNLRTKIMDRFKRKQINLLVATDVAARGIDVKDLTHVINYNLPDQNIAYTHRSGRTGRAQQSGISIAFAGPRDMRKIKDLERIIGKSFERKQVPSGGDIYKKRVDSLIETINNPESGKGTNEKAVEEIVEKLKIVKKEDLIKHLITKEFAHLVDEHKETRDLNAKAMSAGGGGDGAPGVGLKINVGRKHRLDIKGLFALINSSRNLRGIDVGRIDLMPEYSIFSVDEKIVDEVIKSLTGTSFRGRKIMVTKSNVEPRRARYNYSRNRRGRSGGRPGGNRNRGPRRGR